MSRPYTKRLSDEKQKEIFNYWKTHEENGVSILSKIFKVSEHQVSKAIDYCLKPVGHGFRSEAS